MNHHFYNIHFTIFIIFLIWGCTKVPISNRTQIMIEDRTSEIELGKKISKKIRRRTPKSKNQKAIKLTNEIGEAIVKVIKKEYNRLPIKWSFTVLEDRWKASAICLPNGDVFIYSGLFPYIDNRDELAVVIGHEMAHTLARHKIERKTNSNISNFVAGIMKTAITLDKMTLEMQKKREKKSIDNLIKDWMVLPHSRTDEYEADHIGLVLSTKAGYNPKAGLSFWRKFTQESIMKVEYFSTHPSALHRIEKIEELMPSLLSIYRK